MHPRTVAITVTIVLLCGIAMRYLAVSWGLLPGSEEEVLKRAVTVNVVYGNSMKSNTVFITDAAEVQELLATLRVHDGGRDYGVTYYTSSLIHSSDPAHCYASVDFYFPGGALRSQSLTSTTNLNGLTVDRAFYDKLCEIVSRHEGKRVDLGLR